MSCTLHEVFRNIRHESSSDPTTSNIMKQTQASPISVGNFTQRCSFETGFIQQIRQIGPLQVDSIMWKYKTAGKLQAVANNQQVFSVCTFPNQ